MSQHDSNHRLDTQLRDVPLPDGLLERLRSVAGWSDNELDGELRRVPVPDEVGDRLKQAVLDESIDERLRDVEIPWGLLAKLRNIPRREARRTERFVRFAAAASLFLLITASYVLAVAGILGGFQPDEAEPVAVWLPYDGPTSVNASVTPPPVEIVVAANEPVERPVKADAALDPDVQFVYLLEHSFDGPAGQLFDEFRTGLRLWDDVILMSYGPLGFPDRAADDLPELDPPPLPPRGGVSPPVVPQYNRRFLVLRETHPVVFPAGHESLATSALPVSTDTSSFDLTQRLLAEKRLPAARSIRVEDFLAAVDYQFPPARPGEIGLRISAGPSAFGRSMSPLLARELGSPLLQSPAGILQVGVQAGRVPAREQAVTHLTVALDVSASMRWGGRLEMAQRALRNLIEHLQPRDRLSLIVFNDRIVHRIENAGAHHVAELQSLVDRLEADGGTNIAAALQQAVSLALLVPQDVQAARRLVLITDGRARLDEPTVGKLQQLLTWAIDEGLLMDIMELNEDQPVDEVLQALADAAGSRVRQYLSPERLRWELLETLTGSSSLVASDVEIRVAFDPNCVLAYRLLGHEANSVGGLLADTSPADLHSGEATAAMYELWLLPGTGNVIGTAELSWLDAATGQSRRERREITRLQFATSFAEASLPLQYGMLAAETAEAMRGSPFSESRNGGVEHVLDLADQTDSMLAKRPSLRRFREFLQRIEDVRLRRVAP